MHLVSALSSGMIGAEQGSATFTKRGSAANTTIYRTFEGSDPDSSGTPVALDTNGAAEVYVDTLTTVKVFDKNTEFLRTFTAGAAAPLVEVRSTAFTGQEYDDGSGIKPAGPSQPTTLQAVLDLWKTVNGGTDWRVGDTEGNEFSLRDLIIVLLHQSVDVTSPQYGAIGDGVSDDLAAFVLADIAATAQGGATLLVPASSNFYRWSAKFTLGAKNSMLGLGADNSIIRLDGFPTGGMIDVEVGGRGRFIRGLTFQGEAQGYIMRVISHLELNGCDIINQTISHRLILLENDLLGHAGDLHATDCEFELGGSTSSIVGDDGTFGGVRCVFERCKFSTPDGTYTGRFFATLNISVSHCVIEPLGTIGNSGNSFSIFEMHAGGFVTLSNSDIVIGQNDGTGLCRLFRNTNLDVLVREQGNRISVNIGIEYNGSFFERNSVLTSLRADEHTFGTNFASGSPALCDSVNFSRISMTRTSGSNFTFDLMQADGMDGLWCTVRVKNSSGGNITTVSPGVWSVGNSESISNGRTKIWLFRASGNNWSQVGTPQDIG